MFSYQSNLKSSFITRAKVGTRWTLEAEDKQIYIIWKKEITQLTSTFPSKL